MTLYFFFAIFYPIAIYIAFMCYREFKGMLFDSGLGGMNMMQPPMGMPAGR
jgi:hypothetical protein